MIFKEYPEFYGKANVRYHVHNRPPLVRGIRSQINHLNVQLNPICQLRALLGAHPILYISRIRVNSALSLQSIV